MAQGSATKNPLVVSQAKAAMNKWKYEVANELGIQPPADGYWGNLTSRDCGAVGGHMVRKMIEMAEASIANANQTNR
ncbi:Small, acid-soluble spore protein, alpha/beta type [Caldanaerobius fijiensis DSM 17918]|uniref:Small, acid-soluble spore protein, alpha/beta type n=1 Tax=Caldanaerobius fijiensis DSM 17918 TaxID=1121256 RepID=A0A1M4ZS07_9THEO|nr:alpha/beta-type small acid-soluble spore protein [Caldanaerobius fijiensis]SHF20794.1 Small, acid-soluble spore protein, alpha/beta type [Caldanaerobius fijiensis DSM 17918]